MAEAAPTLHPLAVLTLEAAAERYHLDRHVLAQIERRLAGKQKTLVPTLVPAYYVADIEAALGAEVVRASAEMDDHCPVCGEPFPKVWFANRCSICGTCRGCLD